MSLITSVMLSKARLNRDSQPLCFPLVTSQVLSWSVRLQGLARSGGRREAENRRKPAEESELPGSSDRNAGPRLLRLWSYGWLQVSVRELYAVTYPRSAETVVRVHTEVSV